MGNGHTTFAKPLDSGAGVAPVANAHLVTRFGCPPMLIPLTEPTTAFRRAIGRKADDATNRHSLSARDVLGRNAIICRKDIGHSCAFHSLLAGCGLVGVGGGLLTLDRLASRLVGCDDGLGLHLDGETLGHSVGRDLVLARGLVGLELGLNAGRDLLHGADLEALGGCSGERQLLARRRVDIHSFCGVFGIVVLDRRLVAQIKRDGNGRVLCGRGGSYAVRTPREVIFGFGRGGPTVLQGGQTVRNGRIVGRRRRCVVRLHRRSGLVRRRVRRCGIRGLRALIRRALRLRCLLACALSCNSDSGQAQRLGAEQEREQNGERRRAPP